MKYPDRATAEPASGLSKGGLSGLHGTGLKHIRQISLPFALAFTLSLCWLVIAATPVTAGAGDGRETRVYTDVVTEKFTYRVVKGDTLLGIAGRFGVELDYLLKFNPRDKKYIYPGEVLRGEKRIIVPADLQDGIVVNVPDRNLYLFRKGRLVARYPVGLGKPTWRTPRGEFRVVAKSTNPTWHVPPSIQREMEREGEEVKTVVPPGPDNPLGRWALHTSNPGILIHETLAPESVYRFRSHGCIRMRGEDVEKLYNSVEPGDAVNIIYEPVKLSVNGDGAVYIEVHKDVYGLSDNSLNEAARKIIDAGLTDNVDWERVAEAAQRKDGIAEDVSSAIIRGSNGQKRLLEGGSGTDALPGADGGSGEAIGKPEHSAALQYPHGGISDGHLHGRERLHPSGAGKAEQPDEVSLQ